MRLGILIAAALGLLGLLIFAMLQRDRNRAEWPPPPEASVPDRPVSFGYKIVWFAVKSHDAKKIAAVLGYRDLQPCNWKIGIDRAYGQNVFLTPPLGDWTLVVGLGLPSADSDGSEARVTDALERLSAEFGEAQWFASHRVVDYYAWARYVNGKGVRHYSYLGERGETLRDVGTRERFEARQELANEPMVMRAAAEWSIDPLTLDKWTEGGVATGWLAR
jgi:hypothetical protein